VPLVAQTRRATWSRGAFVFRRDEYPHPTRLPRSVCYPRGLPPGGESESDRGPEEIAGTTSAALRHPHPWCLHLFGDSSPTTRLRWGESRPPGHQAPRHREGLHAPPHWPSNRPDASNPGAAGRRSQSSALSGRDLSRFPSRRIGAPPPPGGRLIRVPPLLLHPK